MSLHGYVTGPDWDVGLCDEPDGFLPCCIGSAHDGPRGCTCWVPIFDQEQQPIRVGLPRDRASQCHDCAYRRGSPERSTREGAEVLHDLIVAGWPVFFCHQGMRRVVEWRHPDGRVVPAGPGDYRPVSRDDVGYLANGEPGEVCAGFAERVRARTEAHSRRSDVG